MVPVEVLEVGNAKPHKDIVSVEYADDELSHIAHNRVPIDLPRAKRVERKDN